MKASLEGAPALVQKSGKGNVKKELPGLFPEDKKPGFSPWPDSRKLLASGKSNQTLLLLLCLKGCLFTADVLMVDMGGTWTSQNIILEKTSLLAKLWLEHPRIPFKCQLGGTEL